MNEEATILIVDDEKANIQVLGNILKRYNYKIAIASNGKEALSIAADIMPDLILLDVMMPIMDGFETCRILKADPILSCIPILFITALHEAEDIVKGFEAGGIDYVLKPFDSRVLISRMRTHLLLKKKTKELEVLNRTLEDKVEQRTQELEKANKDLQKLDEMKSEFLSIISHEIRTPLNGILGFTELIRRSFTDDSINQYIEALDQSAKRLERFSINALSYTFLRSGKYFLDCMPVDLTQIIDQAIIKLKKKAEAKSILIKKLFEEKHSINADKKLIQTCFVSILDNAIRFTPNQSEISITVEVINNQTHVRILDQGSGFSEKALESLFKAFAPGETFFNENEGLELALCNLIMDSHKGSIQVRNLDHGAEVSLIFKTN